MMITLYFHLQPQFKYELFHILHNIIDLPQCLGDCSINMYAVDTVMYFTNLCTSDIARVVQDDLKRVVQWMESSRLVLNQSKIKSMLLGSWQNLAKSPNFCIQLYGKTKRDYLL